MKSNQERSNECLPPKKRELPASTLASEERPLVAAPAPPPATPSAGQHAENLAWLASVAGGQGCASDGPQYKPLYSMSEYPSSTSSLRLVSSLPTVYTSPLSQGAVGGTIHYTQLPPNLQFIPAPYASVHSYISPQLLPPPPPPPPRSSSSSSSSSSHRPSHSEASSAPSQASKLEQQQQRAALLRASMPPPPTDAAPRAAPSPHHQGAAHLSLQQPHHHHHHHPHHTHHHPLGHGLSRGVVVQYADAPPRREERPGQLHNGELERGRRFAAAPESGHSKPGGKSQDAPPPPTSSPAYEARQLLLPSDYAAHRTSLMLAPNSHGDHQPAHPRASPEKPAAEKGGLLLGKPVNRGPSVSAAPSSLCTSSFTFPPPLSVGALSPHTVIQTTHNATESLSLGLPSTSIYAQPPILGYMAEGGQQPISYHNSLPQHLLIPGPQPVIIPVSAGGVTALDPASSAQAPPFPDAVPQHAYVGSAPKGEAPESAVVQAQLHLPVLPPSPAAPPAPPGAAPPSLPPYFIKGSIIRLADGELKHVEDLKTEDFIQSAEISSELKIDSSTVERIDGSHASPDFALVQFSVGEHRSQVSVEVLLEYPFFVFGQGWSSCCPDRTTQLLDLPCTKLSVGDVCISLTLKNLRNGSLKKAQSLELATPAAPGHLQPRAVPGVPRSCSGGAPRQGEQENGLSQRGSRGAVGLTNAENGELGFGERPKGQGTSGSEAGTSKPPTGRKRRWSAPEGRKVEKIEEEPPLTLPKPSFIPHEVKVSIEGRSNIGK